jgi:hypothetical protein
MGSRRFRCRSRKTGNSNLAAVSEKAESALYAIGVLDQGGSSFGRAVAGPGNMAPAIRPWFRRMPNSAIRQWRMASRELMFRPHRGRSRKNGPGNKALVSADAESALYAIGILDRGDSGFDLFGFRPHRGQSRKKGNSNEVAVSVTAESVLYATGVWCQECLSRPVRMKFIGWREGSLATQALRQDQGGG